MKLYIVGVNDMKNDMRCCKKYVMVVEASSIVQAKHRAMAMCKEEYKYFLKGDYLKVTWVRVSD